MKIIKESFNQLETDVADNLLHYERLKDNYYDNILINAKYYNAHLDDKFYSIAESYFCDNMAIREL